MEYFEFDWDENNLHKLNVTNSKRGITKEELESIFDDPDIIIQVNKYEGSEKRYQTYGLSSQGRLIFVIFALRENKICYSLESCIKRKKREK